MTHLIQSQRMFEGFDYSKMSPYCVNSLKDLIPFGPLGNSKYLANMKKLAGYPEDHSKEWKVLSIHPGSPTAFTEEKNFESDPWYYVINEYGFRDVWKPEPNKSNIAFFGCSVTFGEGLHTPQLYSTILANKLKMNRYNFGIPGAGSLRIARTFVAVQQVLNLKYAVVCLPHAHRVEYADQGVPPGKVPMYPVNLVPGHAFPEFNSIHKKVYKTFDDNFVGLQLLQAVTMILESAKANNTKVFFCTWDMFVLYLLGNFNIPNLYENTFRLDKELSFARDGVHPGPVQNKEWADNLYKWM